MVDKEFLEVQRTRLMRRREKYHAIVTNPWDTTRFDRDRSFKAHVMNEIIPLVLKKIDSGTYGICLDCHDDIPRRRLEIVPAALRCQGCESTRQQFEEPHHGL
jgi:RNA polymerase-binding transcription factor DksA